MIGEGNTLGPLGRRAFLKSAAMAAGAAAMGKAGGAGLVAASVRAGTTTPFLTLILTPSSSSSNSVMSLSEMSSRSSLSSLNFNATFFPSLVL